MDWWLKAGKLIAVGGNKTFYLDEPASDAPDSYDLARVWLVHAGQVELFTVDPSHGNRRRHLVTRYPGQALFDFHIDDQAIGLRVLVSGVPGTQLLHVNRAEWLQQATLCDGGQPAMLLDEWLLALTNTMINVSAPNTCLTVKDDDTQFLAAGQQVSGDTGICWVHPLIGHVYWLGERGLSSIGVHAPCFPVTCQTWLEAGEDSTLRVMNTLQWLSADAGLAGLAQYYRYLFRYYVTQCQETISCEQAELHARVENEKRYMSQALSTLASVTQSRQKVGVEPGDIHMDPLFAACQAVAKVGRFEVAQPPSGTDVGGEGDALDEIAKASRLRQRQVALKGDWWRQDNGPLLGYLEDGDLPIALLPVKGHAYDLYDPTRQVTLRINRQLAAQIKPFAYAFYRPLPSRKLKVWDLLLFGGKSRVIRDLMTVVWTGLIGGLLGLAVPLATGALIDTIIPEAESGQLTQMALIVFVSMIAVALFQLTGAIAMLRLQTKVDNDVQSAVWDRLLNLPATFFKQYTVGDLAMRANSINAIRKVLSGATLSTIMTGAYSSFHFWLLFYYDIRLSMAALLLVTISVAVTVASALLILRLQRDLVAKQGRLTSLVLQLLGSIAKLRVAGAEARVFYLWAQRFSEMRRIAFKTLLLRNYAGIFGSGFPIVCSLVLFALAGRGAESGNALSTGQFLAFYAAFTTFITALTSSFAALITALDVIPLYERVRPIMEAQPEAAVGGRHPGRLTGEIELSHVCFRYQDDGPLILNDVSLTVHPGEFVAIVGPSGSGKSTLFRILLGFEKPQTGVVYYDRQDMSLLDAQVVRRQFGVVLQNSMVMEGDLLTNIIGAKRLTINDAEEAAQMVGLDEDIAAMPMGMHTVVSEGGGTLSGGQRQRLLIARAIVAKPRIIYFDEATSALDNRTQAVVTKSLEQLRATRVVIAHRLSTIMKADRIYVMDRGRIVQAGTYDELMAQHGLFQNLAQRQLA